MITDLQPPVTRGPSASRLVRPGRDVSIGAVSAAVIAAASCWLLGVPTSHVAQTAAMYAVLAMVLLRRLPANHPGPGIGLANRVTLARATLVLPVAALTLQPGMLVAEGPYWWIVGLSSLALLLDSVDGQVARRSRTTSAFGARFDMELDAFLLVALSVLVWESGKVGSWVILIGALRYLFVLAGYLWPSLDGALPPSLRRKTVCAVQGITLLFCLGPVIPAATATVIAAVALATLAYSFAVDVMWLASRPETVG